VRDGLEDVAAIALLEQQIRRHHKAGTQRELVKEAEEKLRIALRDVMELSDEAFVESRDFLRAGDRVLGHTWTDVELYRRHRAEIARFTWRSPREIARNDSNLTLGQRDLLPVGSRIARSSLAASR
jgi:hypothetical protein